MDHNNSQCQYKLRAIRDAVEVIQGKWRLPIVLTLTFGPKRFGELQREISDISPKMLSQELKSLEESKIIIRTLYDSMPVTVEYSLTPLGMSMKKMLDEVMKWGVHLREEVIGKKKK